MSTIDVAGIREEYMRERLEEADVKAEPIVGPNGVRYEIIRAPEIAIPN